MNKIFRMLFLSTILLAPLFLSTCSKSITAIGNFEGKWTGDLYWPRAYDELSGKITIEIQKDRTFTGDGLIDVQGNLGPGTTLYVDFGGDIRPNGALTGQCRWWKYGMALPDSGITKIEGAINPVEDYGTGTIRISNSILQWYVFREGN